MSTSQPDTEKDPALDTVDIEIKLLLEAIYLRFGYDFREYGRAHTRRRILHRLALSNLKSVSELQHFVLWDDSYFPVILQDLSINTTEMFRDPEFFLQLRKEVVPLLKTYPFSKIWHAGCSSGEEVYSMSIILHEEGITKKIQLYATDFNTRILKTAKEGIYPLSSMKEYSRNYLKSGGTGSLSDYYSAKYDSVIFKKNLRQNVVFAEHNLVTDSVFGEMNLIVCRNTLIYFSKPLQDKVIKLFYESLIPGGILCLGSKESLTFSPHASQFEPLVPNWRIYRKRL